MNFFHVDGVVSLLFTIMKEIKTRYYIKDWAGNYMFEYITFPTDEDASEFLLNKFPGDEELQEYYIDKVDGNFIEAKEMYEFMQMLNEDIYTKQWADRVRHLIN